MPLEDLPPPRTLNYKRVESKFKTFKTKSAKREAAIQKVVSDVLVLLRTFIKENVLDKQQENDSDSQDTEDTEKLNIEEDEEEKE